MPSQESTTSNSSITFKVHGKTYNQFQAEIYLTRAVLLPNHKLRVVLACWELSIPQPAVVHSARSVDQTFTISLPEDEKEKIRSVEFFVMGRNFITEITEGKVSYYQKDHPQTSISQLTALGKKIYSAASDPEGTILLSEQDDSTYIEKLVSKWACNLGNEHFFSISSLSEDALEPLLYNKNFQDEKLNFTEANIGGVSAQMLEYANTVFPLFRRLERGLKDNELSEAMVERIKKELSIDFITPEVEQVVMKEINARKACEEVKPVQEPELESKENPPLEISNKEQTKPLRLSASPDSFWSQNKTVLATAGIVAAAVIAHNIF